MTPYAFRCQSCGHLEPAAHAGENALPRSCSGCAAGVVFDAKGNKTVQPENWEVLADATPARLTELDLTPEQVARHTPLTKAQSLASDSQRVQANLAALAAKERHWDANKAKIFAEHAQLDAKLATLTNIEDQTVADAAQHTKHLMRELVNQEFTERDRVHRKVLEAGPTAAPGAARSPRSLQASAFECTGAHTSSTSKV